jgi:hypothetical protein
LCCDDEKLFLSKTIIEIYRILKTGEPYQDAGAEAVDERKSKNRELSMIRQLERCGYAVSKATA